MAVLGRLLISGAERIDLPDLLSIDSYTAGDFKFLIKGLVGDTKPYILKGFDIIDPQNAIGTQSCSIRVAESVVLYPGSNAGPFYYGLEEGNEHSAPLVPELRKNAVNYVYLTFSTFNTSADTRAFWDPDKDGGVGGEFTQDVNTESVLKCEVNVSVGSFPANTIPIAKITVGPVVITNIEDARDLMFRLGAGGINPNPYNTWNWRTLPAAGFERTEPPTAMSAGGINPFQGADKNIWNLKEWMDAVMSKLQELGGTTYWYQDASTYSLIASFTDAMATTFKSKGKWKHDANVPGQTSWTEDINIKITSDPRTYIVRNGTKQVENEQVLYIPLIRNELINNSDQVVAWINNQPYVNTVGGAIGLFANLSKGDWIKKTDDPAHYFLRVEEFYDSVNLGGSTTTAANARSIRLSGQYLGTTENEKARFDKGVYAASDVEVADRDSNVLTDIGGNFHWMAVRSDTIQVAANIETTALTVDITEHVGGKARVESLVAHGLQDNDRIQIVGSNNFDGIYSVEVESNDVFYIEVENGPFPDETNIDAYYAVVTTGARSTDWGLQLESANHGFGTDDTIIISDTSSGNYDGQYKISVRDETSFNIAVDSDYADDSSGLGRATLAKIIVRAEQGTYNVVQGGTADIGGGLAGNIKQFLGMTSDTQTYPNYNVPPSYNALDGMESYNSLSDDNVTVRLSKLTAMMADKAQDKTIKYLAPSSLIVTNTTNGAAQELTFDPNGQSLILQVPGSRFNCNVTLPNASPGISLLGNQVAYVEINRNPNASYSSSVTVVDKDKCPINENIFVVASRVTGSDIWLWNDTPIVPGSTQIFGNGQDRNIKLVKGGIWSWDGTQLTSSAQSFIQVPGLQENRNTLSAAIITLPNDGDCAYVNINRTGVGASVLTVNTSHISVVPITNNTLILARRNGNDIVVGTNGGIKLINGQSRELDSGLSIENRQLIGNNIDEATSAPEYSSRGSVNRITDENDPILEAVSRHDTEFDKYFGQLRLLAKTAGNKRRVRVTGTDRVTFTGETLIQEIGSLKVHFTGAEIDFQTGQIFVGNAEDPMSVDFTVPMGVDFTPVSMIANSYAWYSIAANPAGTNSDNTLNIQFNIMSGTPDLDIDDATKPALGGVKKLGYIVVKDNGSGGAGTILEWDNVGFNIPGTSAQAKVQQLGIGSGSGGGGGLQKVTFHDPLTTVLPTGSVTIDGEAIFPDDEVLFSNLTIGSGKIYKAVGTIGNITSWQSQFVFNGSDEPERGDTVIIQEGDAFGEQVGKYTGTDWVFNDKVRYFNGVDYWEQSNINTTIIANNVVAATDIFSIAWAQSENIIVDYSIVRGTTKETGTIHLTTDGTTIGIASNGVDTGNNAGVNFHGAISGSNLKLQYTSSNSGSTGQMKWSVKRWSDGAGGPGGLPSYSSGGTSNVTGGGGAQQIGIWSSASNITGNSNFTINTSTGVMNVGGVEHTSLVSVPVLAGVRNNQLLFSYSSSYKFAVIDYSIEKGAGNLRQGTLNITQDGVSNVNVVDTYSELGLSEISLASPIVTHTINSGQVEIRYSSTGGSAGTFKYSVRRWQ